MLQSKNGLFKAFAALKVEWLQFLWRRLMESKVAL